MSSHYAIAQEVSPELGETDFIKKNAVGNGLYFLNEGIELTIMILCVIGMFS